MIRTPLVAGNWKCYKTTPEARDLAVALGAALDAFATVDIVVCPPSPALAAVADALSGSRIRLGGQDCFWEDAGAYTGQVSARMLRAVGCEFVIIGHSERRGRFGTTDYPPAVLAHFGDTDPVVNRKLRAALQHDLLPILCVGETHAEREEGRTNSVVRRQLEAALEGVSADEARRLIVAYEPVWAIGTGESCDPEEANRLAGLTRMTFHEAYDPDSGITVRVLYGGSVTPENARGFFEYPEIDGALVGGASLDAARFGRIVEAAMARVE